MVQIRPEGAGAHIKQHALNQWSPAEGKGKGQKLLAQGNGRKQHALKGQKLLAQGNGRKQHALKGQKLLAQGNALGNCGHKPVAL